MLVNGFTFPAMSEDDDIRRTLVEADPMACMVTLPGQLFYSTQTTSCPWFLAPTEEPRQGLPQPAPRSAVRRSPRSRSHGRPDPK